MKIAIIGSGNIGGLFGTLLTRAGHDATVVARRDELAQAIKKEGFTVETSSGEKTHAQLNITADVASAGASDLAIIAVKGYSTREAIFLRGMVLPPDYSRYPDTAIRMEGFKSCKADWKNDVQNVVTLR
jgi:2-dehydropantoate 2-reductase